MGTLNSDPTFSDHAVVKKNYVMTMQKASAAVIDSLFDVVVNKRPEIDVSIGLDVLVDKSIQSLISTGLVFNRASILVCIDRDNSIHQLNVATIGLALAKLIQFTKTKIKDGKVIVEKTMPPVRVAETIAKLTQWLGMPIVDCISDHPFVAPDGRMVGVGYDVQTRNFGRFTPTEFSVIENPTTEDALLALETLRRLLQTFEFETVYDEAAAIAAMLSAVVRPGVATSLLNLIDAPMSGSGKGYLGGILARLAHNKEAPAKQMHSDEAELRKSLLAELIAATPVLFFDEVGMQHIDSEALRSFITAPVFGGRLLGANREINCVNKTFTLATANNVSPTADMARRTLNIRLNPGVENPSARKFDYKAHRDMQVNRNMFISQIIIIQKAFLLARERGETDEPSLTVGGFDEWELLCRLPVMWLTGCDPCHKTFELMKTNSAKSELLSIMAAWTEHFGNKAVKAGDALKNEDFMEACIENIKRKPGSIINSITLGLWIKKHKGAVAEGRRFEEAGIDNKTKTVLWAII